MKKKIMAVLVAAGMVVSLAACGGSSQTATGTAESAAETVESAAESVASAAETVESTAAEAAESTAAEVATADAELVTVTEGKLTMSTNAAFPPYEMTTDSGDLEGIDIEVAGAIAKKLGLELQVDDMDFDAALLAAQQGKSDIVMAGVSVTEERQKVMEFSDSYATGVQVIIVKEDSDIASVEDLDGKMIGTQRGTTGNIYCTDDYGEDHITTYDNGLTAVQALMNGQVDCVVIDQEPAKAFVAANQGLKILDTEYVSEDYAIGMAKGNTALQSAVNKALAELQEDGTVQSIVDKYIAAK
ncbi:MAG: amino acid ABC transporter substrate-binding protein [Lachnospiraceae bacterium]|nr:amino acid ABC transporter substrate-binding protein [Lachnospiraceae bacterium]